MRVRVVEATLLFCHSVVLSFIKRSGRWLKRTVKSVWASFFDFRPYLGEKSKNFSVSGSSYGHTQHLMPAKLT